MYKIFSLLLLAVTFTICACKKDIGNVWGKGEIFNEGKSYSINKAQRNIKFLFVDQGDSVFAHNFNFTSTNSKNKASLVIITNKKELISGEYILATVSVNVVNGIIDAEIALQKSASEEQSNGPHISLTINADNLSFQFSSYNDNQFGIKWKGKFND